MKNLILLIVCLLGVSFAQPIVANSEIGITGNSVGLIRLGMEAEKILKFTKPISDKLETIGEGELIRVIRINHNGILLGVYFEDNKVSRISVYDRGMVTSNGFEVGTQLVNLLAFQDLKGGIGNDGLVVFSPSLCGISFLIGMQLDKDSYYPPTNEDTPQEWTIPMFSELPKNLVVKEIFVYGC